MCILSHAFPLFCPLCPVFSFADVDTCGLLPNVIGRMKMLPIYLTRQPMNPYAFFRRDVTRCLPIGWVRFSTHEDCWPYSSRMRIDSTCKIEGATSKHLSSKQKSRPGTRTMYVTHRLTKPSVSVITMRDINNRGP